MPCSYSSRCRTWFEKILFVGKASYVSWCSARFISFGNRFCCMRQANGSGSEKIFESGDLRLISFGPVLIVEDQTACSRGSEFSWITRSLWVASLLFSVTQTWEIGVFRGQLLKALQRSPKQCLLFVWEKLYLWWQKKNRGNDSCEM